MQWIEQGSYLLTERNWTPLEGVRVRSIYCEQRLECEEDKKKTRDQVASRGSAD